ncbi:hypothetical protein DE146DRAFT_435899 [Phaeosphaeria sp. MPI-PUGE-AT-0046c]|nr:hypothetical protein DE146DRAFT_435899 [Phaeosphaeria sp. MPI-PUGE-AT-0046c]
MLVLDIQKVLITTACLFLTWLLCNAILLLKDRQRLNKYSGPPMHPILGHLIAVAKTAMKLPARVHPHIMIAYMVREYNLPPFFVLDTRPASVMNLIVADP